MKLKVKVLREEFTTYIKVYRGGMELVSGSISKIYPYKGKFQPPSFEWDEEHEASHKDADVHVEAMKLCIQKTWEEWSNISSDLKVKLRL